MNKLQPHLRGVSEQPLGRVLETHPESPLSHGKDVPNQTDGFAKKNWGALTGKRREPTPKSSSRERPSRDGREAGKPIGDGINQMVSDYQFSRQFASNY